MRRALHATRSTTLLSHPHPHHSRKRPLHVYTHGEGFLGALGHGDFSPRAEALPVAALASKDVQCVSAGWTHSAAVCRDGEVLVWGRPFDLKQPLRVNRIQRVMPFVVTAINALASSKEVLPSPVSVALGGTPQPKSLSVFLDARPTPQQAAAQQPAAATTTATTTPHSSNPPPPPPTTTTTPTLTSKPTPTASPTASPVAQPPPLPLRAKSVACSAALTVILDHDGKVYCMGYNRWGQCGQGPENVFTIFEPLRVGGRALEHERVTSLAVGFQQVLVLCESGNVFGWGKGLRGQLGIGCEMIELPVPVELPGKVVDLRSGFSHAVAVLENGDVYIWGRMQGTKIKTDARVPVYEDQLYPRKVEIAGGGRAVEAFCSSFNTLLRMEDGRIMMFGLEADTRKTVHSPVEVDIPASRPGAFFGGFNDTILKTDGNLRADGDPTASATASSDEPHQFHRITFTSEGASVTPFALPGLAPDSRVESVSVGWQHTVALLK